jgi:hypothetical protein
MPELYDLARDIGEKTNLFSAYPEKAAELYQDILNYRKKMNAQMPMPTPECKSEEKSSVAEIGSNQKERHE